MKFNMVSKGKCLIIAMLQSMKIQLQTVRSILKQVQICQLPQQNQPNSKKQVFIDYELKTFSSDLRPF